MRNPPEAGPRGLACGQEWLRKGRAGAARALGGGPALTGFRGTATVSCVNPCLVHPENRPEDTLGRAGVKGNVSSGARTDAGPRSPAPGAWASTWWKSPPPRATILAM